MTQILGPGEGKTSSAAKEPVVERKPAQVFFESMALAAKTQPATGETYPKSDLFNKAA
nr:hypothetical protein [Klebsiella pneumoniae]